MRMLPALSLAAAMTFSTAAFAQPETVSVDLSGVSAELAAQLGIDADDLPSSINLSAAIAAEVCGVELETIGATCTAANLTADLTTAIENELDNDDDADNGNSAENSAREFAPGQQEGSARDAAPGQQDGHAKDFAPGQVKKSD
jgi:type IV secretory pathway TrbL component